METNKQRKTNKNKNKKKKKTTVLSNITQKNTRIAGKTVFSLTESKNKRQDKSKNTNEKQQNTKNKPT